MNDFWSYWYFHIPNFVLAALMYTLLGRLVLGFFVEENWDNYIWHGFKRITDPFLRVVRFVTPAIITLPVVMVFGVLWLMGLRLGYLILLANLGMAPMASQAG
jgi:uncharacterized protein YggT (Ycf19 family)